jgi:hypothetical protein
MPGSSAWPVSFAGPIARHGPDPYFIYLHRDPRETVSSMIDAWLSGTFHTYLELPGWRGAQGRAQ